MRTMRDILNAPYGGKGLWFWFLSPMLFLVSLIWARVAFYRRKKGYAKIPPGTHPRGNFPTVICCGNVIVGGTGKSPFVRALASDFLNQGTFVAIVARGIGKNLKSGVASSPALAHTVQTCFLNELEPRHLSDENREHYELLKMRFPGTRFVVFQGKNRMAALNAFAALAAAHGVSGADAVAILDDGLQSFATPRHVNVCLWDPALLALAPSMCLPVGPYREGCGSQFSSLLGNFDVRVWSRTSRAHWAVFLRTVERALRRFGQEFHSRDVVVVGEPAFFLADAEGGSLCCLPASEPVCGGFAKILCVTGVAHGARFVEEMSSLFPAVHIQHVNLPDHAGLSRHALKALAEASCVMLTAKDYFRWCNNTLFCQSVRGKRVIVVTVDVQLCSIQGEALSPMFFLSQKCSNP
jgi:tetraacyldisaccharide-1-P 4'-kinase